MTILDTLQKDHQKVLEHLKAAEKFVRHIEKSDQLDLNKLNHIVDSILGYFSSDLHEREEAIFARLKMKEFLPDRTQLFSELEAEHKACHELLKNLSRQIQPPIKEVDIVKTRLVENIWTVIELRRRHIDKVQQRVYPFLEGYVPRKTNRTRNLASIKEAVNFI